MVAGSDFISDANTILFTWTHATDIISFIAFNNTFFLFLCLILLNSSRKGLLKVIFSSLSFLTCFTAYSLTLEKSTVFWIVQSSGARVRICIFFLLEQSANFSFTESTKKTLCTLFLDVTLICQKASGPDCTPVVFLKNCEPELS